MIKEENNNEEIEK